MNKDKWTQQLHDKLADREVSAPEDLWADIEAALPKAPVGQSTRRSLLIPLRRWAIAASLAALVAGGGYLWWQGNPEEPLLSQNPDIPKVSEEPKTPENTENTEGAGSSEYSELSEYSEKSEKSEFSEKSEYSEKSELSEKSENSEPSDYSEQPLPQPEQASQPAVEATPSQEETREEQSLDETIRKLDTQIAMLTPKQQRMATVSLYASNGLTELQSANGVRMSDELAARYDMSPYLPASAARARAASEIIYLTGYEERQKHYQPIAFGLTFGYPLSARLSLSTGMVYTRLRSDFTIIMNDMSISRQQTLHYLGIPLNAQFHVWQSGHLNVYLSAGGEADYNIKAKMVSNSVEQHMNRDRWQFSLQGGVGLQYDVLPQLGFYAEPGVKYYFDNGSWIDNYFKDQSFDFHLQVGLRLNLFPEK